MSKKSFMRSSNRIGFYVVNGGPAMIIVLCAVKSSVSTQ